MILRDILGSEHHPTYRNLSIANLNGQYHFLVSIIEAALAVGDRVGDKLSETTIKALNYHAIACLDDPAGQYRSVDVSVGDYEPPTPDRVPSLMRDFVLVINRAWDTSSPVALAAYCLWRLNHIHPFVNGNGRTARALCYYVLCVKLGGLPRGGPILPELILRNRREYITHLKFADANMSITPLIDFLRRLLISQSPPASNRPAP